MVGAASSCNGKFLCHSLEEDGEPGKLKMCTN